MSSENQPHTIGVCVFPPTHEPTTGLPYKQDHLLAMCETLAREIEKRVPGVDTVEVRYDTAFVCSHCGALWVMPEDSPHNGGCCPEDEEVKRAAEDAANSTETSG